MYNQIIAKPSEVWIKSNYTRNKMMNYVLQDIQRKTKERAFKDGPIIYIEKYSEEILNNLLKVFGIKTISPVIKVEHKDIETAVLDIVKENIDHIKTFRITASRAWKKYPKTSIEIQKDLGSLVLKNYNLKVDLHNPDLNVFVDIYEDYAFVYDKIIHSFGGLPLGIEGTGLVLFSGGLDSPIAALLAGKRGIDIDALFVNPGNKVYDDYAIQSFKLLKPYFPEAKLYKIDLSFVIDEIKNNVREGYRQIIFKRVLYRLADKFSLIHRYDSIITGESIGQTSSQTLKALKTLNITKTLVIRPLSNLNKEEVMHLSRKYGFYETTHKVKEFCRMERHSNANPSFREVDYWESKVNVDYDTLIQNAEILVK